MRGGKKTKSLPDWVCRRVRKDCKVWKEGRKSLWGSTYVWVILRYMGLGVVGCWFKCTHPFGLAVLWIRQPESFKQEGPATWRFHLRVCVIIWSSFPFNTLHHQKQLCGEILLWTLPNPLKATPSPPICSLHLSTPIPSSTSWRDMILEKQPQQ